MAGASLNQYIIRMLKDGRDREEIEKDLLEKGYNENFIKEFINEAIQLRTTKRRVQGLALIVAGVVICFLGLAITVTLSHNSSRILLYGFVGAGIIVACVGLLRVF